MIEDIIFNEKLYMKVREARKERNLPMFNDYYPENGRIFDHELENKKIFNTETNTEYIVQSVHKQWYCGWYYIILAYKLYETNKIMATEEIDGKLYGKSHSIIYWENISCVKDFIIDAIEENIKKYRME